jgi:hypothetical protein
MQSRAPDALRKDMRMMEFESFVNHILSHARQCHQRDLAVMNERCGTASAPYICRTRYKSVTIAIEKICDFC